MPAEPVGLKALGGELLYTHGALSLRSVGSSVLESETKHRGML